MRAAVFAALQRSVHAFLAAAALLTFTTLARADAPATIDAISPTQTLSPAQPVVSVPITITRADATPLLGFSITLELSANLSLSGGTSGITEGAFLLPPGGGTSFLVTDLGGGVYRVDGVTLGEPCGSVATAGTLFSLALETTASSGSGTVTLTATTLRDCGNASLPSSIGSAASATIDYSGPSTTLVAPNGGELWPVGGTRAITWTASDPAGVDHVDLAYSTDGGLTYANGIVAGLANSGSYSWAIPSLVSLQVRVRVTAVDALGNSASDASNADFTIRPWHVTVSANAGGTVTPSGVVDVSDGASRNFLISANSGFHIADVVVDGGSVGTPSSYLLSNVTADHTLAVVFAANPAVAAIADLAAAQVRTGNDADGTTKIRLTWSGVALGSTVQVWRAAFGNYPAYDGGGSPGSVPAPPASYPPGSPWTITAVTSSGSTDEPSARDFWYYVAYVTDTYATRSGASNRTSGTLDYVLGDVHNGSVAGLGDNRVELSDISLLGGHYGLTGAAALPYTYLDVGPTTDFSVRARPTTDGAIDFEDLVMFAIDYGATSVPQAYPAKVGPAAGSAACALRLEISGTESVLARLWLRGGADALALSTRLDWDPAVVVPVSTSTEEHLAAMGGLALSPRPGSVDVAAPVTLGGGDELEVSLASVTFRRIGAGDPRIEVAAADARDAANRHIAIERHSRSSGSPTVSGLAAVQPNPVREGADLSFSLASRSAVELAIHGVDGRRVRTLVRGVQDPGEFRIRWDGRDDLGRSTAPGVYFVRLVLPGAEFSRTVVRLN